MFEAREPDPELRKTRRCWCFTLAHPSIEEMQKIKRMIEEENEALNKAIVGIENGKNEEFEHLQGYLNFNKKYSIWQLKRHWSERAHWECAKGSARQNFKYCSKEGNVLTSKGFDAENDKIEKERQRNQYWLECIRDAMKMPVNQFIEKYPKEWLLRRTQIERIMLEASKKSMKEWNGKLTSKNVWMWGAPGLGKSRWANKLKVEGETFRKNYNKWWCGMETRTVQKVIIEDWPPAPQGEMLCQHLKVWGDRYPFGGETKGSCIPIMPGRFFIIITSNYAPNQCFSREEDRKAIERRFSVIRMTKENVKLLAKVQLDIKILATTESFEEEEEEEPISLEEAMTALAVSEPAGDQEGGEWEYPEAEW
jgi:hypothetical protein